MPRPPTPATPTPAPTLPGKPAALSAVPTPPLPARVRRRGRVEVAPEGSKVAVPVAAKSKVNGATIGPRAKAPKQPKSASKARPRTPAKKPAKRTTLSALDAAAKVLEGLKGTEAREGIGANDLIGRLQRARLWTSPGGKTPAATLYAAMLREITLKKGASRFSRVSPGRFAFKASSKTARGEAAK